MGTSQGDWHIKHYHAAQRDPPCSNGFWLSRAFQRSNKLMVGKFVTRYWLRYWMRAVSSSDRIVRSRYRASVFSVHRTGSPTTSYVQYFEYLLVPLVGKVRREKRHDWGSRGGAGFPVMYLACRCVVHMPPERGISSQSFQLLV